MTRVILIHNLVTFPWFTLPLTFYCLLGAQIDDFIHSLEKQNISLEIDAFGTRNGTEETLYNGAIILSGGENVRVSTVRAVAIIGQFNEKWSLSHYRQITYMTIYFALEERFWAMTVPFKH